MKVAVVDLLCNSPYYCGPLTAALRRASVDAELVSPRFYPDPGYLDAFPRARWVRDLVVHLSRPRPVRLALRAVEAAANLSALLTRIARRRYDVVHVQWVPLDDRSSAFMRLLRARCDAAGTRLVLTAHNAVPHDHHGRLDGTLRENLALAQTVIAHTEHVAAQLRREAGLTAPISVIPHGPLFTDHAPPDRDDARRRLALDTGPVVLFLGLIRPYKGVDLLVDAWPAVRAAVPGARLLVVGKVDPQAASDVARLRELPGVRLDDRYVPVKEMLDYYAASDLVVFPYRQISQSGALMTAVGLGRPTVVTPIDGLLEQTRDLSSATVAAAVDGAAVATAVIGALETIAVQAAAAAVDREALDRSPMGWPAVARATIDAYEGVRAGRAHAAGGAA